MTEVIDNAVMPGTSTYLAQPANPDDAVIHVQGPASTVLQAGSFRVIAFDPVTKNVEFMMVTGGQNTAQWEVTRGIEGTIPVFFNDYSIIKHVLTSGFIQDYVATHSGGPRSVAVLPRTDGGDDSPNIQAAHDAVRLKAFNAGNRVKTVLYLGDSHFNCETPLSFDAHFVSVYADGAVFDFSNYRGGATPCVTSMGTSDTVDGVQSWGDAVIHILDGITMIGPHANGPPSINDPIALQLGQAGLPDNVGPAHASLHNTTIRGFGVAIQAASNCYLIDAVGTDIFNNYIGFNMPFEGIDNAGEGISFIGGKFFGNCHDVVCSGPGTDLHLIKCSFDYGVDSGNPAGNPGNPKQRKISVFKGRVFCSHCHFEDTNDIDWWFSVNDPTCSLVIASSDFTIAGTKTAYELGIAPYANTGFGGITLRDCHLNGVDTPYLLPSLIGGRGRALVDGITNEAASIFSGVISSSPYAPGSRYESRVDHSFGITFIEMTASTDHTSPTITIVGGGSPPSNGALVSSPGVITPGTTVVDSSGFPNVVLSAPPLVDHSSASPAYLDFDSDLNSTTQTLSHWDRSGSTAVGDEPVIDALSRSMMSDGSLLNSLRLKTSVDGNTASAKRFVSCSPGQVMQLAFKMRAMHLGANGDKLNLNLTFYDLNGASLGSTITYSYFYDWQPGTNYSAGKIVVSGGNLYQARFSFTSGGAFNSANWLQLTDADTGWILGALLIFPTLVPADAAAVLVEFAAPGWTTSSTAWISDLVIDFDGRGSVAQGSEGPGKKLLALRNLGDVADPSQAVANILQSVNYIPQAVIDQLMPWHHEIIPFMDATVADDRVGTWAAWNDPNALFSGYLYNGTSAQNDEIGWFVTLAKGTWEFVIMYVQNTDAGILQAHLDGVAVGANIDSYAAALAANQQAISTNIAVASSGVHSFSIRIIDKNASSSSYKAYIQAVRLRRIA